MPMTPKLRGMRISFCFYSSDDSAESYESLSVRFLDFLSIKKVGGMGLSLMKILKPVEVTGCEQIESKKFRDMLHTYRKQVFRLRFPWSCSAHVHLYPGHRCPHVRRWFAISQGNNQ